MTNPFSALQSPVTVPVVCYGLSKRFGSENVRFGALTKVVYFEKLGIAFNRIKKNANTSMLVLLNELENGKIEHHSVLKRNSVDLVSLSLWQSSKVASSSFLVVIRNPYTRVLSAFLDKFRREKFTKPYGAFPLDKDGFGQFLRWLADGGLAKNGHWDLQAKLMLLPASRYDKVIQFENLQAETVSSLRSLGIEVGNQVLSQLYPSDRTKKTDASMSAEQFYDPSSVAIVRDLFRSDFEALGYSKIPPWNTR